MLSFRRQAGRQAGAGSCAQAPTFLTYQAFRQARGWCWLGAHLPSHPPLQLPLPPFVEANFRGRLQAVICTWPGHAQQLASFAKSGGVAPTFLSGVSANTAAQTLLQGEERTVGSLALAAASQGAEKPMGATVHRKVLSSPGTGCHWP